MLIKETRSNETVYLFLLFLQNKTFQILELFNRKSQHVRRNLYNNLSVTYSRNKVNLSIGYIC